MASIDPQKADREPPAPSAEGGDRPAANLEFHPELAASIQTAIQKLTDVLAIAPAPKNPEVIQNLSSLFTLSCRLNWLIRSNARQLAEGNKPKLRSALESLTLNLTATIDLLAQKKNDLNSQALLIRNFVYDMRARIRTLEQPIWGRCQNLLDRYLRDANVPVKILTGLTLALPLYIFVPIQIQDSLTRIEEGLTKDGVVIPSSTELPADTPTRATEAGKAIISPSQAGILSLFISFVFVQSLFFKFSGSPETDHIFGTLDQWAASFGFEGLFLAPGIFNAYVIGTAELIASILLLIGLFMGKKLFTVIGASMSLGIISGAIFFHLFTPLGIVVLDDGGTLFGMAVGIWISSILLLIMHKSAILGVLGKT
ncbi:MAG: DoxX family protein [Pseudomonadota bacterium]